MIAARAEMAVSEERRSKLGQRDRRPNHHQHQAHKPFQKVGLKGLHQPQRHQQQQDGHQESWDSETLLDEEIGRIGT